MTESQLHRSQLHVWNLWREERGAEWPGLPPEFAADCLESFGVDGPDRESLFQAEVRQTLEALLEAPLEEEVRTPQGMLLDLVATVGGVKVSFEVDGPSHFIDGRTPNGYTLLKRRLLRSQGFAQHVRVAIRRIPVKEDVDADEFLFLWRDSLHIHLNARAAEGDRLELSGRLSKAVNDCLREGLAADALLAGSFAVNIAGVHAVFQRLQPRVHDALGDLAFA